MSHGEPRDAVLSRGDLPGDPAGGLGGERRVVAGAPFVDDAAWWVELEASRQPQSDPSGPCER